MGVRAWRPPSWWMIALVAFILAAAWFLPKRAWLAKALSLGTWFLLGAFLIQIRGRPPGEPQPQGSNILALADGRPLTLTGRVMREGYARAAGPQSIRETVDLETEEIASEGESWQVRAGVRLTIYQKEAIQSGERAILDGPMTRSPDHPITRSPDASLWHACARSR
jgi:hypothetical protein